MPIPLGIFAVAGAGAAGGFAYEQIETVILNNSTTPTVTFSSIPSTYKHLQIRSAVRGWTGTNSNVSLRFNGVTTSSYAWHGLWGFDGGSVQSDNGTSTTFIALEGISGNDTAANNFGGLIVDILDYANTAKNTTTRGLLGQYDATGSRIRLASGLFNNTSAISSITLGMAAGGNFITASRFSLYGIRG
jgi:hypothetical protein